MSQGNSTLVGSVFERKPSTAITSPQPSRSGTTGFPAVQHRSKSAFARNRDEIRKTSYNRSQNAPPVIQTHSLHSRPKPDAPDAWRDQMSKENELRVQGMSEEEREEERREILERFGVGVGDLLTRIKQARQNQKPGSSKTAIKSPSTEKNNVDAAASALEEVPITPIDDSNIRAVSPKRRQSWISNFSNSVSPPPPALSASSTRPSSRADRRLRFAELSPQDVHVYESAPPSPRRKILALPPPLDDGSAVSLGQWKGVMKSPQPPPTLNQEQGTEPDEGTAEYIRRRYFPDAPANDPNLAWMEFSSPSSEQGASGDSLRFDLAGKPVPRSLSATLPTHLGLHHHADGAHAGYTLDDVFLLSRSSVPAQRATMLGVLAKIAQRVSTLKPGEDDEMSEFLGKEEELRKRIIGAGVEAMSERGSVGARAIKLVWQCVVGWNQGVIGTNDVELGLAGDDAINSLPFEFLLPQIGALFVQGEGETLIQLLEILIRLAQQSNTIASSIVMTPNLIANMMQTFLLTPLPLKHDTPPPNPSALEILIILTKSSRSNATALEGFADALLRFIAMLPPSSPHPAPLAISLLTSTLRFYTSLAAYGLYSHIASTAMTQFTELTRYITSESCQSRPLITAWLDLLEAWTTCAIDPHQTTPTHEILWSQIVGWAWHAEVGELQDKLGAEEIDWDVWAGIWQVKAAWLEGSKINSIKAGVAERLECTQNVSGGFESGKPAELVTKSLDAINLGLSRLGIAQTTTDQISHLKVMARHSKVLTQAIRLWLACLPSYLDGPLASPPFPLPFPQISELCARITTHPVWGLLTAAENASHMYMYCRPLSTLLAFYLRLSRRLPGISQDLWMAQTLSILSKLLPGDEEAAGQILEDLSNLITAGWATARSIQVPSVIWERGGMGVIRPFLAHAVLSHSGIYLAPISPTSQSIKHATTQRLPPINDLRDLGLPLKRDWTLIPLDDLLRSGSSEIFKALPASWDASEVDIVRASLLFTKISREILRRHSLVDFILTREEAVFGCMKVFMLEHGQPHNDSTEEVFRDRIVVQFMNDLLRPYTVGGAEPRSSPTPVLPPVARGDLEETASRFLGKTPFYQYYTDLVALYDAISFSDPLFARLLLPPTSMRYAPDYRKHLWNDFRHVLKTIRTPIDQVISGDIKEHLWPMETDAQMIGLYLRSLLKDSLQGFIRVVAVHHITTNIWSDIGGIGWNEDRGSKLLSAVVEQGSRDLVREVVRYHQAGPASLVLTPPHCFEGLSDSARASRLGCVERWGLLGRLSVLFDEL